MNDESGSRTALVLSGGGAYGAYEVGVMKALFNGDSPATGHEPLVVDGLAGTSVGSFSAAVTAAHSENGFADAVAILERIWRESIADRPGHCGNGIFRVRGAPFDFFDCLAQPFEFFSDLAGDVGFLVNDTLRRTGMRSRSQAPLTRQVLELIDFSTFIDRQPFEHLVQDAIPLQALGRWKDRLKIVATNFDRGRVAVFTGEQMADGVGHAAVLASAAIPGFFSPVTINGDLHVDGGTLMNTPIIPMVHGAETLHVVYLDPDITTIPIELLRSTIGVIDRLMVTSFAFSMNQAIDMIYDFNRSIELARNVAQDSHADDPEVQPLLRMLKQVGTELDGPGSQQFTTTTIHRYHPREDLGGALGFLNFNHDQVSRLIERGYRDTIEHDCIASGCALAPQGVSP